MIDKELTERLLGNTPYTGSNPRVKGEYIVTEKVIVKCDECCEICGRKKGTAYGRAMEMRRRNGGRDLCDDCYFKHRNPYIDFDKAKERLIECIQDNGGLIPPCYSLEDELKHAIGHKHGGYSRFVQACKLSPVICLESRKPLGYWSQEENVVTECRLLQDNCDFLPSVTFMRASGMTSLANAIDQHGGSTRLAKKHGLQLSPTQYFKANDGHYVQSGYEYNVDNLLHEYSVRHETFPRIPFSKFRADFKIGDTYVEVSGYKRKDKSAFCQRYHARLRKKLKHYELHSISKIVVYCEEFLRPRVVLAKLQPLIDDYGDPEADVDVENIITPVTEWVKEEFVLNAWSELVEEIGHFPTTQEASDRGFSSLVVYTSKFHDGIAAMAQKLGYTPKELPRGYWKDFENVKEHVLPACKHLGYFPAADDFRQGQHGLSGSALQAIREYHGGPMNVAHRLDCLTKREYLNKAYEAHWSNIDNVAPLLKEVADKAGRSPTQADIVNHGSRQLLRVIDRYHDGVNAIKEKLGYPLWSPKGAPSGRYSREQIDEVLGLDRKGYSHREIAEKTGMTQASVAYHRQKAGKKEPRR